MGFRQRPAEDSEVLRVDIDHAPVDRAPAGDDAVACGAVLFHPEFGAAVGDEHVEFLERALVEQKLHPFARRQLALGVLRRDALFAAAHARRLPPHLKFRQNVLHYPSADLSAHWPPDCAGIRSAPSEIRAPPLVFDRARA